jgi:hypothetical protein
MGGDSSGHKDAGADGGAYAKARELNRTQDSAEAILSFHLGEEHLERFLLE